MLRLLKGRSNGFLVFASPIRPAIVRAGTARDRRRVVVFHERSAAPVNAQSVTRRSNVGAGYGITIPSNPFAKMASSPPVKSPFIDNWKLPQLSGASKSAAATVRK